MVSNNRGWLLVILSVLVVGLLLAACADENGPGENGLNGEDTPGTEGLLEDEGEVPGGEEGATLTAEETPTVEETPTPEMTATVEVTEEAGLEDGAGDAEATEAAGDTAVEVESYWMTSGELIGLPVTMQGGEQIARIVDVLIDEQGVIHFVVFEAGAFLGVDEHMVAVEWDVMEVRAAQDAETTDESEASDTPAAATSTAVQEDLEEMQPGRTLVYTADRDELENELEIDTTPFESNTLYIDSAQLGIDVEESRLIRASQFESFDLLDYDLINELGDDLGEIEQLLFDLQEGQVIYAIADVGGFLGIGENAIAIPWALFEIDQDAEVFILSVQQETLTDAPTIDLGTLEDEGFEEGWNDEYDTYWEDVGTTS